MIWYDGFKVHCAVCIAGRIFSSWTRVNEATIKWLGMYSFAARLSRIVMKRIEEAK